MNFNKFDDFSSNVQMDATSWPGGVAKSSWVFWKAELVYCPKMAFPAENTKGKIGGNFEEK